MQIRIPKRSSHLTSSRPPADQKKAQEATAATATPPEFLTIKQVAALLQVCTKTARKIIDERDIPVRRLGRRRQIRVRRRDLELFMDKDW